MYERGTLHHYCRAVNTEMRTDDLSFYQTNKRGIAAPFAQVLLEGGTARSGPVTGYFATARW